MRSWQVGINRAVELLFRPRMWDLLSNTLTMMAGVTLISIVWALPAPFVQRYRFFGKPFSDGNRPAFVHPRICQLFTWISLTFRVEGFWGQ